MRTPKSPAPIAAWLLFCAFLNCAGWLLSAVRQLNAAGFPAYEAAPALQPPTRYFEARKVFYAALGPMGIRFQRLFDEMKKIHGFPLATATDARMRMGKTRTTVEATEVRKGAIPASVFEVPADYKKVASAFAGRG